MIYHICTKTDWQHALTKGIYEPDSLRTSRFIHFSTREQVVATANLLYKGQPDLILLEVDETGLEPLRFEPPADDREALFPHLYRGLRPEEVKRILPFPAQPDGTFELPEN